MQEQTLHGNNERFNVTANGVRGLRGAITLYMTQTDTS